MSVLHGTATLQQDGAHTTITTGNGAGTRHSAIDWRSFSVPAQGKVYFAQPDALSTSINRVTGPDPSSILGTLGSNGRLVLVNPAGIAVGPGAVVDTAGFTASTLPMSTADMIAGRLNFGAGDTAGAGGGKLSVEGQVLAKNGDVVLIGPQVQVGAPAVVRAQGGDVILAAGRKVYLTGRGLEGIRFEVRAPSDRAINLGRLEGDSVAIFASLLQHSGSISAQGAQAESGKVVLQGGAQAEIAGSIRATAPAQGGSVLASAERLVLKSSTSIDVSHANGGGEILLGGGWQGGDARIRNAQTVDVEEGALLKADATLHGPGGTVVAWSEDTTRFGGTLSALGAGPGGAGGRAEVSGRRQLVFRGKVDLGAADGPKGRLLLDPDDVTIQGGNDPLPLLDPLGDLAAQVTGAYTVYQGDLQALNANVDIQANKSIKANGSFTSNELLIAPDRDLRLEIVGSGGGSGIQLAGMPIRTQGSGKVELVTAGNGHNIDTDRITTAGGTITLSAAGSNVHVNAALASAGGAISIAGKNVNLSGSQVFGAGTQVDISASGKIDSDAAIVLGAGAVLATGSSDLHNLASGSLAGSGTLALGGGKLQNDGALRPGGPGAVGDLRVLGDLDITPATQLEIDVAGPGSYDRLLVSGNAKLDGMLSLNPLGGYAPAAGDGYGVLQAAAITGRFSRFTAPAFPGFNWQAQGTQVLVGAGAPAPAPATGDLSAGPGNGNGNGQGNGNGNGQSSANANGQGNGQSGNGAGQSTGGKPNKQEGGAGDLAPVAAAPLAQQPEPVQAAIREPLAATQEYLAAAANAQPLSSSLETQDRGKRRVVLTPVACRTE
nr:filamentous hemagglutinin N-terminal domain-containing protein [Ramlibacter agri]